MINFSKLALSIQESINLTRCLGILRLIKSVKWGRQGSRQECGSAEWGDSIIVSVCSRCLENLNSEHTRVPSEPKIVLFPRGVAALAAILLVPSFLRHKNSASTSSEISELGPISPHHSAHFNLAIVSFCSAFRFIGSSILPQIPILKRIAPNSAEHDLLHAHASFEADTTYLLARGINWYIAS